MTRASGGEPPAMRRERAFSQATGLVYQIAGVVLALGGCCWWSFAGLIEERLTTRPAGATIVDVWRAGGAAAMWAMGGVCVSFAGGLALAAVGLGLQAERRRSGALAVCVAGAGAAFWGAYLVWGVVVGGAWGRVVVAAMMFLAWGVCVLLGAVSADELRRFPPPANLGTVPPDFRVERLRDREMPEDLRDLGADGRDE